MLRLVVKNEKAYLTCQDCQYFDQFERACGIYQDVNVEEPLTVSRCHYFHARNKKQSLMTKEFKQDLEPSKPRFYTYQGQKELIANSSYPLKPDRSIQRQDAVWFTAPDQSFGCWIINHSKQKLMLISTNTEEEQPDSIYKSFVPLHDHEAPLTFASSMVWYVDENGYGQYAMLDQDSNIIMLTAPNLPK